MKSGMASGPPRIIKITGIGMGKMASMNKCPFDRILDPDFVKDPYPAVALARETDPVHRLSDVDMWLVTRYADIKAILRDTANFLNRTSNSPIFPFSEKMGALLQARNYCPSSPVSSSDGDVHKRMRMNVAKALAFTPSNLREIKIWTDELFDEWVLKLPKDKPFDIVELLTSHLPGRVVYRLIGFPPEMFDQLLTWAMDRVRLFWSHSEEDEQLALAAAMADYWDYCVSFVQGKADDPGDDLTGNLIRIHLDNPDKLSLNEVTTVVFGLVFAGQETTSNATAEMIYQLLRDRTLWEKVAAEPALIDAAFEETLRIAPPVAAWRRLAVNPVSVAGQEIPEGHEVLIHFGSAGHDAAKFEAADEFRLDRNGGNEHFAFGNGAHFCLGAPLARVEARSMMEALQRHLPGLRLVEDQEIDVHPNLSFRGPTSLLVTAS